ncbi:MAG: methyltransferase family protein [Candidatus Bathyarchaeia archaeon]
MKNIKRPRAGNAKGVQPRLFLPLITDLVFVLISAYLLLDYLRFILLYTETPGLVITQVIFTVYLLSALFLLVVRNKAIAFTPKAVDYVYTLLGVGAPLLFQSAPEGGPLIVGASLEFVGLVLVVSAFLSLNRSFGLAPENRGIKKGGAYGFVRHPMYLGYILAEVGLVFNNFSIFNLVILTMSALFLLLRLRAEEHLLQQDRTYRAYARRVRWKLIPFIF